MKGHSFSALDSISLELVCYAYKKAEINIFVKPLQENCVNFENIPHPKKKNSSFYLVEHSDL